MAGPGGAALAGGGLRARGLRFAPAGAGRAVLAGCGLDLAPGRAGLVYGGSGSGKTTLVNVLAGLLEPDEGRVAPLRAEAGGEVEEGAPLGMAERRERVGVVFQFPERHFLGDTVSQELAIGWPLQAGSQEQKLYHQRLQAAAEATGLAGVDSRLPPWELSGGYQRRLAITVQLMRRPDVLILDEPLAGLDRETRQEVVGVLKKLKAAGGMAILVVSHDIDELVPLIDETWEMKPGGVLVPMPCPMSSPLR